MLSMVGIHMLLCFMLAAHYLVAEFRIMLIKENLRMTVINVDWLVPSTATYNNKNIQKPLTTSKIALIINFTARRKKKPSSNTCEHHRHSTINPCYQATIYPGVLATSLVPPASAPGEPPQPTARQATCGRPPCLARRHGGAQRPGALRGLAGRPWSHGRTQAVAA